jgi:hypothetical protein
MVTPDLSVRAEPRDEAHPLRSPAARITSEFSNIFVTLPTLIDVVSAGTRPNKVDRAGNAAVDEGRRQPQAGRGGSNVDR